MTDPTTDRITEVLAAHLYNGGGTCTCDGLASEDINGAAEHRAAIERHRAHVAAVLADLFGDAQATADPERSNR